eukprot:gene12971-27381_t
MILRHIHKFWNMWLGAKAITMAAIFSSSYLGSPITSRKDLLQSNFLFIMFDDLRPELNIYGKDYMITPNFNRLAAKSVMFDHAYCQVS